MSDNIKEDKVQHAPFIHPGAPNLTKLYANGFVAGRTNADIYIIGLTNSAPNFVLNMSISTAKNLKKLIDKVIIDYEDNVKTDVVVEVKENIKKPKK